MSDITIRRHELDEAFKMVREPMNYVDEIDMDSYAANMGYDNDDLVSMCLDYLRDNIKNLPEHIIVRDEDCASFIATIAAFMTRMFHVGLVLGRQHPIN